jgi:branched-chain amino acid transport system permease protein
MSTIVLLTITGLGLGALYFLIASGLSLIYGLMGVLNFAHGAFITVGSYSSWYISGQLTGIESSWLRFAVASLCGLLIGAAVAVLVEIVLIRPLYRRHIEQVLVTVGLGLAITALIEGIWTPTQKLYFAPPWFSQTTSIAGAQIPNDEWLMIGAAVAVLAGLLAFLRYTRYGLIIRAGVENRSMVTALGIDVRTAFTLVFAIGGVAAALAGVVAGVHFANIDPTQGTSLLIYAFIVVVIGGLGSLVGSAVAAVVVGLVQQYVNYYATQRGLGALGDLSVMLLLAVVLLIRPAGLGGLTARLA